MKATIWRVTVQSANYSTNSRFLIAGDSPAVVTSKALKLASEWDAGLAKVERKHKPYVTLIELLGKLDA